MVLFFQLGQPGAIANQGLSYPFGIVSAGPVGSLTTNLFLMAQHNIAQLDVYRKQAAASGGVSKSPRSISMFHPVVHVILSPYNRGST
jgi:hypothetical protein